MWQKYKGLNLFLKIITGIIAFLLFPLTILLLCSELTLKMFKQKKIVKGLVAGVCAIYFLTILPGFFKDVYFDSILSSPETSQTMAVEEKNKAQEVVSKKSVDKDKDHANSEIKQKKKFFLSKEEKLVRKSLDVNKEKAIEISEIIQKCDINPELIEHDEMLDNWNFEGERGFRISYNATNNIILTLNKDDSIYLLRYGSHHLYENNKIVGKINDYMVTFGERVSIEDICKSNVKRVLKTPDSAKFANSNEWSFEKVDGEIVVKSYVDSQNSFGATLRSEFQFKFSTKTEDITSFVFDDEKLI